MRTRTWLPAGAAVMLVVGVLAARGGSAAAEEDLLPLAVAQPSAPAQGEPVLLGADGVPGARLGATGEGLQTPYGDRGTDPGGTDPGGAEDVPAGCVPAWPLPEQGSTQHWDTMAWLVDGVVSAVVLRRWDPVAAELPGLRTWLGPTIGSPVAAASALPGARTSTVRPHGDAGPVVTVVHVPGDGVEVVFSDAADQMPSPAEATARTITTVEVRHRRARACSVEAVAAAGPDAPGWQAAAEPVMGPDGLTSAPLGTPVAVVRGQPGMQEEGGGPAGCESFSAASAGGAHVRVVAVDGVVAQTQASGAFGSVLEVQAGDGMEVVRRAYPEGRGDEQGGWGEHEAVVGGRVVTVQLHPRDTWVPDVDVAVHGADPVVQSLTVRDAAVPAARLC